MPTLLLGDPHQHFQTCRVVVVLRGNFGFAGSLSHRKIPDRQQTALHHIRGIFVGCDVNPGGSVFPGELAEPGLPRRQERAFLSAQATYSGIRIAS